MNSLDRRQMLIGSGLLLGLGATDKLAPAMASETPAPGTGPFTTKGSFEQSWHHGDHNPKSGHPGTLPFDPPFAALLHLNLNRDFELEAKRVHFAVKNRGVDNNTFEDNQNRFEQWIRYFNGATPQKPFGYWTYEAGDEALDGFVFGSPHHLLIYIRNTNVAYDEEWPIWFGKSLVGKICGKKPAEKNHSFFDVSIKSLDVPWGSTIGIYVRNYWVVKNNNNTYRPLRTDEVIPYALNINAFARVQGSSRVIPIMIDPDTGNMGDGVPMFGRCPTA